MLDLFGGAVAKIGLAGFAGFWVVKATLGVLALRWLRNWNTKRKGTG